MQALKQLFVSSMQVMQAQQQGNATMRHGGVPGPVLVLGEIISKRPARVKYLIVGSIVEIWPAKHGTCGLHSLVARSTADESKSSRFLDFGTENGSPS